MPTAPKHIPQLQGDLQIATAFQLKKTATATTNIPPTTNHTRRRPGLLKSAFCDKPRYWRRKRSGNPNASWSLRCRLPKNRGFFPAKTSPENIEVFGAAVRDMLETMNYNLLLKRTRLDGRYQKTARVDLPVSQLAECRREIERRLDKCLIDIDNYLTIKRASLAEGEATVRFGVGCYEIQGEGGIHAKSTE